MSVNVGALEGFPRRIFARKKLNEADDKAIAQVNNGAGYPVGTTSIVVDGLSSTLSALIKKGLFFFAGYKSVGAADAVSTIGATTVTIKTFTAAEIAAVKTGDVLKVTTAATDYFYEIIKADIGAFYIKSGLEVATAIDDVISVVDDEPHQVNGFTLTSEVLTDLDFAPALKSAVVDDDDILFGWGFVDVGTQTADSFADEQSNTQNEKKNEAGQLIGSNSVQDSRKLTLNLVENTEFNLMIWGKRIAYVNSLGTLTYKNPETTFVIGTENIYDILIVKDDNAGQYFDLDVRMRYPNCQYSPDSINMQPTAANVSQSWTPILNILPTGSEDTSDSIGNPLIP